MDFLAGLAKAAAPKPDSDQSENSASDLFSSAKLVAEAAQAQFNQQPDKVDNAKVAGAAAVLIDAATKYGKIDESQGVGKYLDEAEGYLRKFSSTGEPTEAPAAEVEEPAPAEEAPKKEEPVKEETAAPVTKEEDSDETTSPAAVETPEPESEKPDLPTKQPEPEPEEEKPAAAESPEAEPEKPTKTYEPDPDEAKPTEEEKPPTVTETEKPQVPAGEEEYVKLAEGLLNKATEGTGAEDYVKAAEGLLSKTSESEGGLASLAGGFFKK